jgi:hypothetical protein
MATNIVARFNYGYEITAVFEQFRFRVNVTTEPKNVSSVYQSIDIGEEGDVVTLWARPFPDYNFVRWSDGNTENPRNIVIGNTDISLVAIYQRVSDTNGIYQYRCFVKL